MTGISIQQVSKRYGKTDAVRAVDLAIEAGEFIVILGPSGCGKSTLLRMIAGLEEITAGQISIGGKVVNRLEPRERGCAMVFQNYALYPHMSVADNIGYALKVSGLPKLERLKRIRKVAESIGMIDFLERKPAQLSGGQRQRVAMGRAMIREPRVFLFDEPLSNLDATLRVQMRIEIRRLHNRLGTTSVFVTHDQVEAMTLADRLVVMNDGVIEQVGRPRDVYANPASRFVGGFIGSPPMNFFPAKILEPGVAVTPSGIRIAYDSDEFDVAGGQDVVAGVRPEAIVIAKGKRNATAELSIEFVEELGAGQLIHASFESRDFSVSCGDGDVFHAAKTLSIIIPPGAVHFFDPLSGKRLATQHNFELRAAAA